MEILMPKITGLGYVVGAIVWLAIMWYATTQSSCLVTRSCKGDDLLMFAAMGVGMLAPAWVAAAVVSSVFGKE